MTNISTGRQAWIIIAAAGAAAVLGLAFSSHLVALPDNARIAIFCLPALLAVPGGWRMACGLRNRVRRAQTPPPSRNEEIAKVVAVTVICCFALPTAGCITAWLITGKPVNPGFFALGMMGGLLVALPIYCRE